MSSTQATSFKRGEYNLLLNILTLRFINYLKFNFGKSYLPSDSHCNFLPPCLPVKMASKTVIRPDGFIVLTNFLLFIVHQIRNRVFMTYVISRKRRKNQRKKYRTMFNTRKQTCMRNLKLFWQRSYFRQNSLQSEFGFYLVKGWK